MPSIPIPSIKVIAAEASVIGVVLSVVAVGLAACSSGGRLSSGPNTSTTRGRLRPGRSRRVRHRFGSRSPHGAPRRRCPASPRSTPPGPPRSSRCRARRRATAARAGRIPLTSGHQQAFVVSEVNGTWGSRPMRSPGTAALNHGGGAAIASVSCASAGNCSAGGSYRDSSGPAGVRGRRGERHLGHRR